MPERKRPREETIEDVVARGKDEVFRALKTVQHYERQRQSKRLRDDKATPEKLERLRQETLVLKSLDLEQTAYAHLISSLLRVKAAAEAPELPEEVKQGARKPEMSEDERKALHNVTSSLYNYIQVRGAVKKAILDVCTALGVAVPERRMRGMSIQPPLAPAAEVRDGQSDQLSAKGQREAIQAESSKRPNPAALVEPDESERPDDWSSEDEDEDGYEDGDEEAETALSRFDARLGGSSDEENSSDNDAGNLNDDRESFPDSPKKERPRALKPTTLPKSTFLPSLMGGYISGDSESASDIDDGPPRKNRRGQRARQQIWEKKYKDKAKHLGSGDGGGRDAGWDPKRGAVGPEDGKPWKKGVRGPLQSKPQPPQRPQPPASLNRTQRRQQLRDDPTKVFEKKERSQRETKETAASHPSWDAARKEREKQETAKYEGKRIVFD